MIPFCRIHDKIVDKASCSMRILNELSNLFILMERDNFIRLATPIILYLPGKLYIIAGK